MARPRESIWSVTGRTRILYSASFAILVTIYEAAVNDKDTLYDTWRAI